MIDTSFLVLEIIKGIWMYVIKPFWWVWVIALGIGLLPRGLNYLSKWLEKRRTKRWLEEHKALGEWKKLDGRKFEEITAIIFEKLGYKTKIRVDGGIDIVAEKDGKKTFIQCKRMDKVPPSAIREFYGSIRDRLKEGEKGIFVTTGEFTQEGKEYAKTRDKPIELIDGFKLEKLANL